MSDDFAGLGGDDFDVEVFDYEDDGCLCVGSADAEVVEFSVASECEFSELVDFVVTDPVVGFSCCGWPGFGECVVGDMWGAAADAAVGSFVVVDEHELVEEGLELGECGGLVGLFLQPVFEGLLEAFDFAACGWVVWP